MAACDIWIKGHVMVDGSADRHVVKDCGRAGWGVVQVDDEGHFIAGAWGPVPASLPQTPQAAEFSGLTVAAMLINGASTVGSDCMNVVRSWNRGVTAANELKERLTGRFYAGGRPDDAALLRNRVWNDVEAVEIGICRFPVACRPCRHRR